MSTIYYIEQNGRYTRDFAYMFESEIHIAGHIFLNGTTEADKEKGFSLSEMREEICSDSEKQIIICRHSEDCPKDGIEELGIRYGKDWVYGEDLFGLLDKRQIEMYARGRKLILWGAGKRALELLDRFPFLEIETIVDIDSRKQGRKLRGKEIVAPVQLQQETDRGRYYILVAAPYHEVKEMLESWDWREGEQFVDAGIFSVYPSELFKKILHAPTLTTWQCRYPFEHVRISPDGRYDFCSFADSIKVSLGNAEYLDYMDYENSVILKLARLSVLNGTYIFCNPDRCSRIRTFAMGESKPEKDDTYQVLSANQFFQAASVDIDCSCNLYCCSCRNEIISSRGCWQQKLTDRVIEQVLPNIDILFLAGSGEVFLSPYYKQVLHADTLRRLKGLMVLSNANICNKKEWEHITGMVDGNVEVSFSIDAATKETYEKIRRGGNFEKVEEHIRYVCGLKREERIRRVILNFVIQRDNYKELERFVLWGKSLGADYFNITFLDNWGTWTEDEFKEICMYEKGKKPLPELQAELDKLEKYGDCILLDDAVRYREMNYAMLMEERGEHFTLSKTDRG